jgi:hypothetical protein
MEVGGQLKAPVTLPLSQITLPGGKYTQNPLFRGLGEPQIRSGRYEDKNLLLRRESNHESSIIQPVA